VAVQTGPYDAQDGDDEQDGNGHIRADEDGGEDGRHDVEWGHMVSGVQMREAMFIRGA